MGVYEKGEQNKGRKEIAMVKKVRGRKTRTDHKTEVIRRKRKEIIKESRDKARNVKRATEDTGALCIVCGKKIKNGQRIRIIPKDKNCQEVRVYHLRTCGPGSENWEAFKTSGKRNPQKSSQWLQLSFNWKK
jgi:RNA polymerase-binding transcription factor DksA